jgi:hypothetical protein
MPLDAEPTDQGMFALSIDRDGGDPIAKHVGRGVAIPGPRYVSHFVTCPNANQHRRPR